MTYPYHRIHRRPRSPNPTSDRRTANHHAQVQAPQKRPRSPPPRHAEGHKPPGPQNDSHDSPPGDANPRMTQNDSHFRAPNPEMTQNDSLFQASMPQMSQNDSHFEVFSFEMTQNDSFSGLKCPTEHPLSVAEEPPVTPPFPQNDTPEGPSVAGHPSVAGPLAQGIFLVASPCFRRRLGDPASRPWVFYRLSDTVIYSHAVCRIQIQEVAGEDY